MKLPNADRAIVDLDKLTDYCLNPDHPRGRHKARVFQSALGIGREDADALRIQILAAAATAEAHSEKSDEYGQRYVVEFELMGPNGPVTVRTVWIIRVDEELPRLITCYVSG